MEFSLGESTTTHITGSFLQSQFSREEPASGQPGQLKPSCRPCRNQAVKASGLLLVGIPLCRQLGVATFCKFPVYHLFYYLSFILTAFREFFSLWKRIPFCILDASVVATVQSLNQVQLFVTPWTVDRHAPLSSEFPR